MRAFDGRTIGGAVIGGYIAVHFLGSPELVKIAASTQSYLTSVGIHTPQTLAEGRGYAPNEIFGIHNMWTFKNFNPLHLTKWLLEKRTASR